MSATNNTRMLMILGMHRSGTSVTASWLEKCGVNIGKRLLGSSFSNQTGHYEDVDFLEVHQEILRRNGLAEQGTKRIRAGKLPVPSDLRERLARLLKERENQDRGWGFKEPRACLFLDTYRELAPKARYLVVYRDAESVVDSLLRRSTGLRLKYYQQRLGKAGGLSFLLRRKAERDVKRDESEDFKEAWIVYNSEILDHLSHTDDQNYLVVSIENLIESSDLVAKRIHE